MPHTKVRFVIDNLGSGGAQKQLYLLAISLIRNHVQVGVLCYHSYGRDFYSDKLEAMGIRVMHITQPAYFQRIKKASAYLKKEKPDTVISFLYGANLLTTILKIIQGGKFQLIVADRTGVIEKASLVDKLRYQLYRVADVVIVNSSHTGNILTSRAPWLKKKIKIIWNMIAPIDPAKRPIRVDNRVVFLLGASYSRYKNHKNWILAFIAALKTIEKPERFVLKCFGNKMGDDNANYIGELETIISRSEHFENVDLYDEISDMEVEIIKSDICVLPSFFEGCPNFIIEGMSAGKVVMMSKVCSNPDILPESGGYLFDPCDISDMTQQILIAMQLNFEERMKMGKLNSERAKTMFDPAGRLEEYLKLINRIR